MKANTNAAIISQIIVALFLLWASPSIAQTLSETRKAADQGDVQAQLYLGFSYFVGQGVKQDYAEALKWYRRAAEQGYPAAQFNLGVMYYKGQDVKQDYAEAVKWYRKAADQGLAAAQYNLGRMYYQGQGVTRNYMRLMWFLRAAAQGDENAKTVLDLTEKRMTPELAEAQKKAAAWKPTPTQR
jgi:TPR repeat protein